MALCARIPTRCVEVAFVAQFHHQKYSRLQTSTKLICHGHQINNVASLASAHDAQSARVGCTNLAALFLFPDAEELDDVRVAQLR